MHPTDSAAPHHLLREQHVPLEARAVVWENCISPFCSLSKGPGHSVPLLSSCLSSSEITFTRDQMKLNDSARQKKNKQRKHINP